MKNIHRINGLIYITSEEDIKTGYYLDLTYKIVMKSVFYTSYNKNCKKVILSNDPALISDGIQAINPTDENWLNDNPSCEWVEVRKRFSDFTVEPFVGYELKLPTHQTIEEAADELTFNQLTGTDRDLAKGIAIKLALSQAARDYWYNIFKSEQQC